MIRISALLTCLLFALPGFAQDNPIVARMQALTSAYNAQDAAAVAAIYAEDGALFAPGMGNLVGRDAIAGLYASAFGAGVGNLRFKVLEIRQHGPNTAVEIGETLIDAPGGTAHARYLHVWLLVDGTWMLSRDIYNVISDKVE